MKQYSVGIIGDGHVGGCMKQLFPNAIVYDKPKGIGNADNIDDCDFAFICVPTPEGENGKCDTSIVEEILYWIDPAVTIIIRSTVPVGFTDEMRIKTGKHIVFQPEYYGETKNHPFEDPYNRSWITLGGCAVDTMKVAELYQSVYTADIFINQVDAKTAELAKYMENCFYATKVVFCNQFYDIAKAAGVDYNKLRETWLLDPRINRSHTFVYPTDRGYGGSCLPKDMAAMIYQCEGYGIDAKFLEQVDCANDRMRGEL